MKWIVMLIAIVFAFSSCSNEEETRVSFSLQPVFNGQQVTAEQVIKDVNGRNFSLKELRIYITDLNLVTDKGEKVLISDLSFLDWPTSNDISATIPQGKYKGIEFYIGLDPVTNNSNPISFEVDHPLSAQQDMHWGMLKYRFLTFIGKVDTTGNGDQAPDKLLQYHLGKDELYSKVELTGDYDATSVARLIPLTFNVNALFSGSAGDIDIKTHRTNHSGASDLANANIIMDNFVEAIEDFK